MSELDEILAEHSALASAGAGQFTVDPRRQRELLTRLGLQNAAQGFLKLCQGIYRCKPRRVHFFSAKNSVRVVVEHDQPLPETLWDPAQPLGLGLLSLSQEYRVDWSSKHHTGHVSPDSFFLQAHRGEGSTSIEIKRPATKWWHRDWTAEVRQTLRRRLAWNRGEYCWNGGRFPDPTPLSVAAQAVIYADEQLPGNLSATSVSGGWRRRVRQGESVHEELPGIGSPPRAGAAHAILGATRNSWSETFFVLDGVLLEGERNLLDRPGVVAVVSADGLTPALSGLELVHDAAFRQRLQGLRPEVSWLDSINQR